MVCKLSDGTEEKVAVTKSIRPVRREEKKDKVVDTLIKISRLYEPTRLRVVSHPAVEVSEPRENTDKLTDEVEAKYLEF